MTEKTCQTLPLDFENIRAKCPCCGSLMKLVMTWKSNGLQFDLVPAVAEQKESGISPHGNSSLMNIVSVASAEQRLKDHMSSSKFFPPPHHRNGITLDEESNSSSLSANSVSRNYASASCHSQISLEAHKSEPTSVSHSFGAAASTSQNPFRIQAGQSSGHDTMFKCEMSGQLLCLLLQALPYSYR